MAESLRRFEAALLKSDALAYDDSSAGAKRFCEKTLAEEVHLLATRVEQKVARDSVATLGITVHGALVLSPRVASSHELDAKDALKKNKMRMLKRKIPSSKDV